MQNADFEIKNKKLVKYSGSSDEVLVPKGVKIISSIAFKIDQTTKRIVLPKGVEEIETRAFDCKSLQEIEIPKTVKIIGIASFYDCPSLEKIILDPKNPNYKVVDGVLYNYEMSRLIYYPVAKKEENFIVPEGVSIIACHAFRKNKYLKSVTLSNSVTTVLSSAFEGCTSLEKIDLGSVKRIDDNAFENCSSLTEIKIPNEVREIAHGILRGCSSLKKIFLPKAMTKISSNALDWDFNLECIEVDEENPIYKTQDGVLYYKKMDKLIKYPCCLREEIFKIPDTVTKIGSAFCDVKYLKEVILPNTEIILDSFAFYRCASLEKIILPERTKGIGAYALGKCPKLTKIVIPKSVKECHSGMLCESNSIREIIIEGAPTMENKSLVGIPKMAKIIAPELVKKYSVPEWKAIIGDDRAFIIALDNYIKDTKLAKYTKTNYCLALNSVIDNNREDLLPTFSKMWRKIPLKVLDTMIKMTTERECTVATAFFLAYKREKYTPLEIQNYEDDIFEKKLGIKDLTPTEFAELYTLKMTNEGIIITKYKGFDENITVPASIKNRRILEIGKGRQGAFARHPNIKTVDITDGIEKIGTSSFDSCPCLCAITIPKSVKIIEGGAINFCPSLETVTIYGKDTKIGKDNFHACAKNLTIKAPKGSHAETFAIAKNINFEEI